MTMKKRCILALIMENPYFQHCTDHWVPGSCTACDKLDTCHDDLVISSSIVLDICDGSVPSSCAFVPGFLCVLHVPRTAHSSFPASGSVVSRT